MPIFAAAGAVCTVLDYSERQLENERMVAQREGYEIEIVRADMHGLGHGRAGDAPQFNCHGVFSWLYWGAPL